MSKINKLQKEVDNSFRLCTTVTEESICRIWINKDLQKLGYMLSTCDKVIPIEKNFIN